MFWLTSRRHFFPLSLSLLIFDVWNHCSVTPPPLPHPTPPHHQNISQIQFFSLAKCAHGIQSVSERRHYSTALGFPPRGTSPDLWLNDSWRMRNVLTWGGGVLIQLAVLIRILIKWSGFHFSFCFVSGSQISFWFGSGSKLKTDLLPDKF